MKWQTLLTTIALLTVLAFTSGSAQIQSNPECIQAKTWHLQQAMKARNADDQPFHLGAAQAADELSTMGGSPCNGWKLWADNSRPESAWSPPA